MGEAGLDMEHVFIVRRRSSIGKRNPVVFFVILTRVLIGTAVYRIGLSYAHRCHRLGFINSSQGYLYTRSKGYLNYWKVQTVRHC